MRLRDLGPLVVRVDAVERPVGGTRAAAVLAMLAIHANEVVSADPLMEAAWGDHVAAGSPSTLGVLEGNAKLGQGHMVGILDEKDNEEQHEVLRRALRGQLGGPLGDLGKMLVELVAIEGAPIEFDVRRGTGTIKAGEWFTAETKVIRTPAGRRMKIKDSPLAPVLGDPVYVGTVVHHEIHDPKYGMEFTAHTALQTDLRYVWNDKVGGFFESIITKRKQPTA